MYDRTGVNRVVGEQNTIKVVKNFTKPSVVRHFMQWRAYYIRGGSPGSVLRNALHEQSSQKSNTQSGNLPGKIIGPVVECNCLRRKEFVKQPPSHIAQIRFIFA